MRNLEFVLSFRIRPLSLACTLLALGYACSPAQAQDMPVALHDGDDNNNSGDEDNKVNKYHHILCASAPGFQPSCASARAAASNIDATTN